MNKKAEIEALSQELKLLPEALLKADQAEGHAVILARVINGISKKSLADICQQTGLDEWHIFPVKPGSESAWGELVSGNCPNVPVSPFREVEGALSSEMFAQLLKREMLRISRNGGCLSLISAGLADRNAIVEAAGEDITMRLEALLGALLLTHLDVCDSMGVLRKGQFLCCLPGIGQLVARNFAEKAQAGFKEQSAAFFTECGLNIANEAVCAMGIVNLVQGECGNVKELLNRARFALEVAINKQEGRIHQETATTPLENTTLVHSSEKRFLFFGGTAS